MSDDAAPAVEQDQPIDAPEAPETETQDQPIESAEESFTDSYNPSELPEEAREAFEAAYKRLQSSYTKKTQTLAEERREAEQERMIVSALRNPQTAPLALQQLGYSEQQILEMLGYDTESDEDDFDFDDPDERIERLEQRLTQREQAEQAARQEEAVEDFIAGQIEGLEEQEGREFDAREHQLLDIYARNNPRPDGTPDVQGAFELLSGLYSERQKSWIESKKTTRPPGSGTPASRTVDLSKLTPEERREERAKRMLHAAERTDASAA